MILYGGLARSPLKEISAASFLMIGFGRACI
jgi:hypothetical protein